MQIIDWVLYDARENCFVMSLEIESKSGSEILLMV